MPLAMSKLHALAYLLTPGLASPKELHKNINTIDIRRLRKRGIKAVVFDADGTLVTFHNTLLHLHVAMKFMEFRKSFKCCILTNNTEKRKKELSKNLGIPAVGAKKMKPHQDAFKAALSALKTKPSQTAIIGDRIVTDVVGGNKAGMYTILVRSIEPEKDPWQLKLISAFEGFMLKLMRKKIA